MLDIVYCVLCLEQKPHKFKESLFSKIELSCSYNSFSCIFDNDSKIFIGQWRGAMTVNFII